jgi:hypothetical protein
LRGVLADRLVVAVKSLLDAVGVERRHGHGKVVGCLVDGFGGREG